MTHIDLSEIKRVMASKQPVIYKDYTYECISACIMRVLNNQWYYQAELSDQNGVTICGLDRVEAVEGQVEPNPAHKRENTTLIDAALLSAEQTLKEVFSFTDEQIEKFKDETYRRLQ